MPADGGYLNWAVIPKGIMQAFRKFRESLIEKTLSQAKPAMVLEGAETIIGKPLGVIG